MPMELAARSKAKNMAGAHGECEQDPLGIARDPLKRMMPANVRKTSMENARTAM